jgi:hypothetical protein
MNNWKLILVLLVLLINNLGCAEQPEQPEPPHAVKPTMTLYVPQPAIPSPTFYIPPSVTPSPTLYVPPPAMPTATEMPNSSTDQLSDPDQFIRWYFDAVWQERDYENLWTFLTPSFKKHATPSGFKEYTDWWESVEQVDLLSVDVLKNNGKRASIQATLTFYLRNGKILSKGQYSYDLVYDADRQTWMFDYR